MPSRSDERTATKILWAAEQAFSRSGITGASIRQINALAGQRNTSAIRYHFGSKDGLLEALISQRMGELEHQRARALKRLDLAKSEASVRELVEALVVPLAQRVCSEPEWGCWVRILHELVSTRGDAYQSVWQGQYDQTSREIFARLKRAMGDLPEEVWLQRVSDLMIWVTASLSERARILESESEAPLESDAYIENLVVTTSSALAAKA